MFFTNIHKILIFILILLPEQQIGALWYETFQSSLVANEYSAENQVKSWQNWLEKGSLVIRCIDVKEYQKTHGQELSAKEFSQMELTKKPVMDKSFVGTSMEDFRCLLHFPPSQNQLFQIFNLLRGFTKVGFFQVDPTTKGLSKHTDVEIDFQKGKFQFRIAVDLGNGQIGIHDMENNKYPYMDKTDGQKHVKKGCFCKLNEVAQRVSANTLSFLTSFTP